MSIEDEGIQVAMLANADCQGGVCGVCVPQGGLALPTLPPYLSTSRLRLRIKSR